MRLAEGKHTLLDNEGFRVQLVRNATVERREPGIAFLVEPRFPMVKQASADTGSVTGFRDTARGFPGLKEQLALLRCGKTIVGALGAHSSMLPDVRALCNVLLMNTEFL
jgi:hypothetical protein